MVSMILFTGRRPSHPVVKESQVAIEVDSTFGDIELPAPVLHEEKTGEIEGFKDSKEQRQAKGPRNYRPANASVHS